ncbi:MAG: aminomethyl-transferring glycine dehydrogenase subunit GcvPA [Planctomycetes bacterium]|jgi:glycine dehydrogenase subunit 1|nr:aminomethyl-transferring glycine dehydrogenase subunit GcvPA [Planctomycetota bacterium]
MPYTVHTPDDVKKMLERIGVASIDDLFEQIPPEARFTGSLGLPPPASELEVRRELTRAELASTTLDQVNAFLGAGAYDHFIPSIVDHLAGRAEFYTAYTPYQPEASQGMLTAIFEYQSMIAALTGLPVSNASVYDGASGLAEAILLALSQAKKRRRVILSGAIHPEALATVHTYLANLPAEIVVVPPVNGLMDHAALSAALDGATACVAFQQPNFFGLLEDSFAIADLSKSKGALLVASVDPISLGLLAPPGEYGADVAVGEGQGLGGEIWYGGPYFGFFATKKEHVRRVPGRLVGQTVDREGRTGYVLTLQTREQHIRRDKATSNICTNQGIVALRGSMYLAAIGPAGIREVAEQCAAKARYAADRLSRLPGFRLAFKTPFFKEFVLDCGRPARDVCRDLLPARILPGVPLSRWFPAMEDYLMVAVTEKKTRAEIDALADALAGLGR